MNLKLLFRCAITPLLIATIGYLAGSLSLGIASAVSVAEAASLGAGDSANCPLRAADLDKLTTYRWRVAQYKAEQAFIPNGSIRIDYCELIGKDDKGSMRTGVMVNIARGANAEAFAKHWHAACALSLMQEARGKVQPLPGVPGGNQCVTANGKPSNYWIESPSRTIQVEPETEDAVWGKILPQVLAAAAK